MWYVIAWFEVGTRRLTQKGYTRKVTEVSWGRVCGTRILVCYHGV